MGMFRRLEASEIDCRIASINENGLSLLLYKDARVDQNILDETVGEFNWQKSYSRDNANCTVSIWDEKKQQWISKEDTGTESYTEKEKGLASDSFKRACFNWGIGRELYSAPFIWIKAGDCLIKKPKDKYVCYDRFEVTQIGYDEKGNINKLMIKNLDKNKVVYSIGVQMKNEPSETTTEPKQASQEFITPIEKAAILHELNRTRVAMDDVLKRYGIKTIDDLPASKYEKLINNLQSLQDFPEG